MIRLNIIRIPLIGSFSMIIGLGGRSPIGISMWVTSIVWWLSIVIVLYYDRSTSLYQLVECYQWFSIFTIGSTLNRAVDGLSVCFVLRTAIRTPRCLIASYKGIKKPVVYCVRFVLIESAIIAVFLVTDRIAFYISFEAVLIPIYRIVGIYGSRERKVRASYIFFMYTLIGSVRRLISVRYIVMYYGTSDISVMKYACHLDIDIWTSCLRWIGCFIGIAVKVPIVPFHIWLPEAHVEAPTGGSVILAGVLLKRGTYGMLRVRLGILTIGSMYYTPIVYTLSIIGIIYPARTAIRQTDMKRIIAYASVSHINMTIVGIWTYTIEGLEGSLLQIVSHGLVAGGRFICIGVRYDRYHTRRITYYGGIVHIIPLFSLFFLVRTIANIGRPGTSSFVGEWIIRVGIVRVNILVALISALGIVRGACYSLWRLNRMLYGNIKLTYRSLYSESILDVDRREFMILLPIIFGVLVLGVYPSVVLDIIHPSCCMRRQDIKMFL